MKKILLIAGFILAVVGITFAVSCPEASAYVADLVSNLGTSHGVAMADIAPWFVVTGAGKAFKQLNPTEFDALTDAQKEEYQEALFTHNEEKAAKLEAELKILSADSKANKETIEALNKQINELKGGSVNELLKQLRAQGEELAKLKNKGTISNETFQTRLKAAFDERAGDLAKLNLSKGDITLTVDKASQTYGDINAGTDYATMRAGIIDKPMRKAKLRALFGTIPITTEYYKYAEQNTVVRDGKTALKCAAVSTNTKETIVVRTTQTIVIKDMISFCRDFIADYPFMQSRIDKLIRDSVELEMDRGLLLGTNVAGETMNSINAVASEFSAANVAAPVALSVQAANFIDLIGAMDMQIDVLSEGEFMPDVVVMNRLDWFKYIECLKDKNDNYLSKDIVVMGGQVYIKGMLAIYTSICPANTCYVFDSTKGEILDRQQMEVEISTTDADDWQKGLAKIMAKLRVNFVVPNNYINAFMKCTDIATAIDAITKA